MRELTLRAIVLGGVITLAFTAANVYIGLKVGLTFATSIPAAVISMVVLRLFKSSSIYENNIVQTVASAAGTLAAIIFVLPGLVMIGWWQGFPYWTTTAITGLGGILGVMFSVPLRRTLVVDTDLPYPEGVAAAEVLRVGTGSRTGDAESRKGLGVLMVNGFASAAFFALSKTGLVVEQAAAYFRVGAGATGISISLSMAMIGAGHLIGISAGLAILTGVIIGSWMLLPILTAAMALPGTAQHVATAIFRSEVRFFGAGVIGVAALWTFARILGPIVAGLRSAIHASTARNHGGHVLPLAERDLPIGIVGSVVAAALALIALLLWHFLAGGPLAGHAAALIATTLVYIVVAGIIIASICGYMAGLVGASTSPVSGVGILAVIAAGLMLLVIAGGARQAGQSEAMVAYALIATAIVFGVATISNDNLQDLKTGQLVGATPWKQQVALIIGVIAGAAIIPPILDLLNHAYGFAGAPGPHREHALPAPQAGLMSALAQGVLENSVDWSLIAVGVGIGVALIVVDALLRRFTTGPHLSPLAVGLGIYLPTQSTLMVVVGSLVGWYFDRRAERRANPASIKQMGILLACGMLVGEGLIGVLIAALVAFSGKDFPLALVSDSFADHDSAVIGTVAFAVIIGLMYRWAFRLRK